MIARVATATCALLLCSCWRSRPAEVSEFPTGFHGDAYVIWSESGYPPLPVRDGMLILHFPAEGVIITSTPNHFGWAKDEAYFYDPATSKRLSPAHVPFSSDGDIKDSKRIMHYSKIFVGTDEEHRTRTLDESKIHELFEKLHPAI
jgi:Family of unknown function (DUF6843)